MAKKIYVIQTHDDSSPQPLKYCATKEIAEREWEKMVREDYESNRRYWPNLTKYDEGVKGSVAYQTDSNYSFEEYHEAVVKMVGRYGMNKWDDDRFSVWINTYNIVEQELLE